MSNSKLTKNYNAQSRRFAEGVLKIFLLALCFLVLPTQEVIAQEKLSPNQPVARTIEPGKTDLFSIALNDGDYFNISFGYKGRINLSVLKPDGTIARRAIISSATSAAELKGSFPFAAEGAGSYSFKIENPGDQTASYELAIDGLVSLDERLKPQPASDPYPTTRIQALRKQISAGQTNTESFWKQVKAQGTPLTEPYGSDGKYQLVTFLWRSTYDTRNVFVIGSFWGFDGTADKYSMHRIPDSDIWYLTLKLPSGARVNYQLSPNDPLTSEGPRAAQRAATRQADPFSLNPLSKCSPETSKFRCRSVAELPGVAPQPWLVSKPGVAEGRVEKQTIKSAIQKIDRPFSVYTPANYNADGPPNALLILFDGEDLANDASPVTTLNNLIAASKIPPTVAVFVENVPRRRLVDLVASDEFADFMAKELVPWVRSHYNVTKDPKKTVVTGYSAGGLASVYVARRHPKVFGNVLSRSGAFWWSFEHNGGICGARCPDSGGRGGDGSQDATTEGNFLVKEFLASPKLPLRFYLTAGTFESDTSGEGGNILETTRHLRDVLLAKGYQVHYQQFVGGHDGLSWRGGLADGLINLLGVH
jgi:enterochelin esterase-like enzyme